MHATKKVAPIAARIFFMKRDLRFFLFTKSDPTASSFGDQEIYLRKLAFSWDDTYALGIEFLTH